jgi:glucose-6-phosphate 1-dehydrogenase
MVIFGAGGDLAKRAVWKALPPPSFPNYAAGSWGLMEADDLLARDGRHWRTIQ